MSRALLVGFYGNSSQPTLKRSTTVHRWICMKYTSAPLPIIAVQS
jgi:hypothetical protein